MPKLRTIIEQELVSARIDKAKGEYPRSDEVIDGLKWWLARKPMTGERQEDHIYMIRTRPWFPMRVPSIRVLYRVTENEVVIEQLAFIEK